MHFRNNVKFTLFTSFYAVFALLTGLIIKTRTIPKFVEHRLLFEVVSSEVPMFLTSTSANCES